MGDISRRVQEQLNEQNLQPTSKGMVQMRRWGVLFGVILVLVLASFLAGVAFDEAYDSHPDTIGRIAESPWHAIGLAVPWGAVLAFLLVAAVGGLAIRHLPKGYRVARLLLVAVTIALPLGVGIFLAFVGLTAPFEKGARTAIPPYRAMQELREDSLEAPEKGVLVGVPEGKPNEEHLLIVRDPYGRVWIVNVEDVEPLPRYVQEQRPARFLGEATYEEETDEEGEFEAEVVLPVRAFHGLHGRGQEPPEIE